MLCGMPKVTIYLPSMKLKAIDLYCSEHKIARGRLLANSAVSFINAGRKIFCDFCHKDPAIGKYRVVIYDWEEGTKDNIMNLCEKDYKNAKK